MSIQIVKFEPSKKARNNGAVALVIALEAPNKKAAEVMATGKLWEAYPAAADNFLKPEIVEDQPGCPRPAVGVFDEQFAIDNELNSELKCWQPRAVDAPPAGPIDLMEQPANVKIAAVVMYGEGEIDNSQLSLVVDMLNDEDTPDDTGMREVINALVSVTQVGAMYPSAVYRLVSAIFEQAGEAIPAKADILAFAQEWVSNPNEREKIKLGSPAITSTKVERTETGATAGVPNNDDRGYPHTLDTLDYEIGAALLPMDFDIFNIPLAIHRRVKEVVAKKESPWKEWSAMLRKTTGVLEFTRAQIFELIRTAKPDLHQFPTSHREYINANLGRQPSAKTKEPEVSNLGDGKFSVDGLIGEQPITASSEGEKTEVTTTEPVSDAAALQAKEALDNLGYGVYATEPEQKSELLQRAEDNAAAAAQLVQQLHADDFQQRAAQVEQAIAEQPEAAQENLQIWKQVQRTDPRYTSDLSGVGYTGTSINAEYMFMRATEIFGPVGIGWGYNVIEDKMIPGAPMTEAIYDNGKFVRMEILRNVDGSLVFELNHSLKIKFWYKTDSGDGALESYGATPYMYKASKRIVADGEAMKKSLTDAIKKALSMLGFSADIYLGMFDLPEYKAENEIEFSIRNASDKAEDVTRLRQELDEKFKANTATMKSAKTASEVSGIASSLTRVLGVHLDSARGKADHDYTKYLESRLNRLEDIKAECLNKLKAEAQP